jgi:hypothetical protein
MEYDKIKKNVKRHYAIYDGYYGKSITVGLVYYNGVAWEVTSTGAHRATAHKYSSEKEMLYYFDNHKKAHFPQAIRGDKSCN